MNISDNIINIINESKKYDEKYNFLLVNILSNAENLTNISNGVYQIEHSIRANKISLKDYVLNSDICVILRDNNIHNYSIKELRDYISKYNSQSTISYTLALDLYEHFEQLENIEKSKIQYEIDGLKELISLKDIDKMSKNDLQMLYDKVIIDINKYSLNNEILNSFIKIVDEIFNYYKDGNKRINYNSNIDNKIDNIELKG